MRSEYFENDAKSLTDGLPVCYSSGAGCATNQSYKQDGTRHEGHKTYDRSFHCQQIDDQTWVFLRITMRCEQFSLVILCCVCVAGVCMQFSLDKMAIKWPSLRYRKYRQRYCSGSWKAALQIRLKRCWGMLHRYLPYAIRHFTIFHTYFFRCVQIMQQTSVHHRGKRLLRLDWFIAGAKSKITMRNSGWHESLWGTVLNAI